MLSSADALFAPGTESPAPAAAAPAPAAAWPVNILGVTFDALTLAGAADRIERMVAERQPRYVVTPNVDFLVKARRDGELHQILGQADLVLCDGKPLVWASHWLGNRLPGRVAGSDLAPVLLERATQRGWRIFLLGGAAEVAAEAARRLAERYPGLPPVAHYSPPYAPLERMDHAEIISRIQAAQPDLVLVCFGCPKQEKWIFRHHRAVGAPVMIGAGGTVDFLADRLKRAPHWMRRTGTEWLFRLWQEPRRLFRRYADDVIRFFPALLAQRRTLAPATEESEGNTISGCTPTAYGLRVQAAGGLRGETLRREPDDWTQLLQRSEASGHCVVDLAEVRAIDSTGLAFLAHWQRRLARARRNLILLHPSRAVRAALAHLHLTEQFIIAEDRPAVSRRSHWVGTGDSPVRSDSVKFRARTGGPPVPTHDRQPATNQEGDSGQ
jgi:exopolysaccharide biosynthesis WecB/TagA/CpsF family protein